MKRYTLKVSLLFSLIVLSLCQSFVAVAAEKRIGILVFDGVLTSDITAPVEVFGMASNSSWFSNYEVVIINVGDRGFIVTNEGLRIVVDTHLNSRPAVDVLIVLSSYKMEPLLSNKMLIDYIGETAKSADWIASNCSGALLLAKAGVLDGKKATTWASGEDDLKKSFPLVQVQYDTNVVIDDGVITSNGGVVSYEEALALLAKISSEAKSREVMEALQYNRVAK